MWLLTKWTQDLAGETEGSFAPISVWWYAPTLQIAAVGARWRFADGAGNGFGKFKVSHKVSLLRRTGFSAVVFPTDMTLGAAGF